MSNILRPLTFQTIGGNIIRDFMDYRNAIEFFNNEKLSGNRCFLMMLTWHEHPGPNGRYVSNELLEQRGKWP